MELLISNWIKYLKHHTPKKAIRLCCAYISAFIVFTSLVFVVDLVLANGVNLASAIMLIVVDLAILLLFFMQILKTKNLVALRLAFEKMEIAFSNSHKIDVRESSVLLKQVGLLNRFWLTLLFKKLYTNILCIDEQFYFYLLAQGHVFKPVEKVKWECVFEILLLESKKYNQLCNDNEKRGVIFDADIAQLDAGDVVTILNHVENYLKSCSFVKSKEPKVWCLALLLSTIMMAIFLTIADWRLVSISLECVVLVTGIVAIALLILWLFILTQFWLFFRWRKCCEALIKTSQRDSEQKRKMLIKLLTRGVTVKFRSSLSIYKSNERCDLTGNHICGFAPVYFVLNNANCEVNCLGKVVYLYSAKFLISVLNSQDDFQKHNGKKHFVFKRFFE